MLPTVFARVARALVRGVSSALAVALVALAGCGLTIGGGTQEVSITGCAQLPGFASATALDLPHLQFPAGTLAQPAQTAAGGTGQYTITTYLACAPHTDASLTARSGKGPKPFLSLAQSSGWAPWSYFPSAGDAQTTCPGSCLAYNAYDPGKGLFQATPTFLALSDIHPAGNGVITFRLLVTGPPPPADCGYMQSAGPSSLVATWYDQPASIQFPPDTISSPDATMSTNGSVQCSPGTVASVKAFMDRQFQAAGYISDPCQAYDCWEKNGVVVSLQLSSAAQWFIFTPRILPTTQS